MISPIVICFYTLDTPYEQEVLNLINSCKKWGVELFVEGKKSAGSWAANCALKPAFILEKLEALKRPVFWADADSVFLKKPDLDQFLPYDFSVRAMQIFQNDPRHALNTASVFAHYTPASLALVRKWRDICIEPEPFMDQMALHAALANNKNARVYSMPIAYCKIFDIDTFFINDEDVVLEQTQASRRYR